jgi:single-strand DNA-binding protein
MNSIILLGRTTAPIELKQTQAGKSVSTFSLAVKRPFTKDVTDFHTICAWDKQAELLSKYVGKGDQICIRGHLTTRSWEDQQGNKRYATEVVASEVTFCEAKRDEATNYPTSNQNGQNGQNLASQGYIPQSYIRPDFETAADDSEDPLPF